MKHVAGKPVSDSTYSAGCLCTGCRAAHAAYQRRYRAERAHHRPSVDELVGADPDWCGGLSVDEYMDRQRGRISDEEGEADE